MKTRAKPRYGSASLPRKRRFHWGFYLAVVMTALMLAAGAFYVVMYGNINPRHQVGEVLDNLNGIPVYFNGGVNNVSGRQVTADGYNLGLNYQCVEFVKRYYYEHLGHKMPDSYGHARSFFDTTLPHGAFNSQRGLMQYANGADMLPQVDDLLVFGASWFNRFGHVAIVSDVADDSIEIIQQNPGPFAPSRERFALLRTPDGGWRIDHPRVLGFLRLLPEPLQRASHE